MANYIQDFLEAMHIVASNEVANTNYTTTITGVIGKVGAGDEKATEYTVILSGKDVKVTGAAGYAVGDTVSVLAVNNDPDKAQYIVGLETRAKAECIHINNKKYVEMGEGSKYEGGDIDFVSSPATILYRADEEDVTNNILHIN